MRARSTASWRPPGLSPNTYEIVAKSLGTASVNPRALQLPLN